MNLKRKMQNVEAFKKRISDIKGKNAENDQNCKKSMSKKNNTFY